VNHLRASSGQNRSLLQSLTLAATLSCARIRTRDFDASEVKTSIDGQSGAFTFSPLTMRLFDGHGSGDLQADFSGPVPVYHVRYRLTQFRLEDFFRNVSPKSIGTGFMDFSATLALQGRTTAALVPSAEGVAVLHGDNLTFATGDLDASLSRFESSQSFNLIDFGAFFFAGPLGLAVTKSYNYARIFQGAPGTTSIRTLTSDWQVEHGVAQATDVAMATPKNRVALKGGLDFVNGRYEQVTVAAIDTRGCVIVQQKVDGPFLNPVLEKPNALGTITGPARALLRDAGKLVGAKCQVFYTGSVAPSK
jgi:AsmA protein